MLVALVCSHAAAERTSRTQASLLPMARSYGRWIQPLSPDPNSQLTRDAVVHWAKVHHQSLSYDWRLDAAVHALLFQISRSATDALPFDAILHTAWTQGFTDAPLGVVAVRVPPEQRTISLQKALAHHFAHTQVNRWALAEDPNVVVAVFSPHRFDLTPIASHTTRNEQLRLAAQNIDPRIRRASVVLGYPSGDITRFDLPMSNRSFAINIETGTQAGILEVQILVEDVRGPQVAAQFPIGVDTDAWPDSQTAMKTSEEHTALRFNAESHAAAWRHQARAAMTSLLWGLRETHGLSKAQKSPTLQKVAQLHAQDMRQHDFFAHISARSGDVTQRLKRAHQPYTRVVENIVSAHNIDSAFAQWQHSPSHRANLLDPSVTHFGIGIAPRAHDSNELLVVLVMARFPDA